MADYFLKATSEDALWTALESAGLAHKEYDMDDTNNIRPANTGPYDSWSPSGEYEWELDIKGSIVFLGTLYAPTGNIVQDEFGNDEPELTALTGYHANIRATLTEDQVAALPTIDAPATPLAKWAGDK